jgi:hypothetical protein
LFNITIAQIAVEHIRPKSVGRLSRSTGTKKPLVFDPAAGNKNRRVVRLRLS